MKTVEERFWEKVDKNGTNGCWIWMGSKDSKGYGKFSLKRVGKWVRVSAYRYSYEMEKGLISKGLELDHLCRNPICVNPNHLEVVSHRENMLRGISPPAIEARQTHCKRGHPFDLFNTYYLNGNRACKQCIKDWGKFRRSRQRGTNRLKH